MNRIERPLAIVVIGGLVTATALMLLLLPVLDERFGRAFLEAGHRIRFEASIGTHLARPADLTC